MVHLLRHLFAAVLGLALIGGAASTAPATPASPAEGGPKVRATLVAERPGVEPGGTVTVGLRQIIIKDWHTYWRNPGDSGEPTSIKWTLPPGWKAGPIQWPYPKRVPVGPLMNFAYEDEVLLPVDITAPRDAQIGSEAPLRAHVLWLVCKDVCIPEEADLELMLTVTDTRPAPDTDIAPVFAATRAKLPHPSPWPARFEARDKDFALLLSAPELGRAAPKDAFFLPYTDGYVLPAAEQKVEATTQGLVFRTQPGWRMDSAPKRAAVNRVDGIFVVTGADGKTEALEAAAMPGTVSAAAATGDTGFLRALLFALLGGIILNLMPCVFPILSMKALALARKAGSERAAHGESIAYAAGCVVTFTALAGVLIALREGGAAVGWGFQLQEPIVVAALALVMLAVALNLAGVYEIASSRFAGVGQVFVNKGGVVGSFFTGALAVVVATPCTAPFMGAALAFALTAPPAIAIEVFVALGVGFALPFIALGYIPALLRALPRPGPWMNTFRQFLAFPMFGAAAWLLWILAQQAGSAGLIMALAAALALAFALWAFGQSQKSTGMPVAWIVVSVLSLAGTVWLALQVDSAAPARGTVAAGALDYEPYSEKRLAELRASGRPVFVNATADWCITCLVNERVALETDAVAQAFKVNNVAALKADWTRRDDAIAALLKRYGHEGVPLYLYFGAGAREPVILPQLLTPDIVLSDLGLRR